jgi:hypothetical protein
VREGVTETLGWGVSVGRWWRGERGSWGLLRPLGLSSQSGKAWLVLGRAKAAARNASSRTAPARLAPAVIGAP